MLGVVSEESPLQQGRAQDSVAAIPRLCIGFAEVEWVRGVPPRIGHAYLFV